MSFVPTRLAVASRAACLALALVAASVASMSASALEYRETPGLADRVGLDLPPVAMRVPEEPLIVDLAARGREIGRSGGEINTLIGRSKDVRLINVWGYARLVGYDEDLDLKPDILKAFESEDDRIFTLRLRKGHQVVGRRSLHLRGHPLLVRGYRVEPEPSAFGPAAVHAGRRQAAAFRGAGHDDGPF